jgi:hypothetical protein
VGNFRGKRVAGALYNKVRYQDILFKLYTGTVKREASKIKINLPRKRNYLPFGSTGRFDEWCHTVSEQILVFADVDNTEDDSLKHNKIK